MISIDKTDGWTAVCSAGDGRRRRRHGRPGRRGRRGAGGAAVGAAHAQGRRRRRAAPLLTPHQPRLTAPPLTQTANECLRPLWANWNVVTLCCEGAPWAAPGWWIVNSGIVVSPGDGRLSRGILAISRDVAAGWFYVIYYNVSTIFGGSCCRFESNIGRRANGITRVGPGRVPLYYWYYSI